MLLKRIDGPIHTLLRLTKQMTAMVHFRRCNARFARFQADRLDGPGISPVSSFGSNTSVLRHSNPNEVLF